MKFTRHLACTILMTCTASQALAQDAPGSPVAIAQIGTPVSALPSALPELRAIIVQQGSGNVLGLLQSASDNQARLEQQGQRNVMTAVQNGAGNRLNWVQSGSDLPDLHVVQSGTAQISIVQTQHR